MATIFLVEDNPDNLKLFRALLEARGFEVACRPNGDDLVEAVTATGADLVLMDIQLPGKDGFALLAELRDSAMTRIPVVALTAHAMAGDRERALAAGFDDYITKPIDVRGFAERVVEILTRTGGGEG